MSLAPCIIRWPKYWSFGFSISPSNEYSGLNSFRIDWFDLLAVQGILKSFLQHRNIKHQFFGTRSPLWSTLNICTWTTGKTISLIIWTFVSKCCLCFVVCCTPGQEICRGAPEVFLSSPGGLCCFLCRDAVGMALPWLL